MITDKGKEVIKNYFGGQTTRIGSAISVGTGNTAAALADTRLAYETIQASVSSIAADLANNRIVFKATLPPGSVKEIHELGLFHQGRSVKRESIVFNEESVSWSNATLSESNTRVGTRTLKVDALSGSTTVASHNGYLLNLSNLNGTDKVAVAFYADAGLASMKIRVGSDASNYRELAYNSPGVGYHTLYADWGNATATGTIDTSAIRSLQIVATAKAGFNASLFLDGLTFENSDADSLVARVTLATPKLVDTKLPTEIEYSLVISV